MALETALDQRFMAMLHPAAMTPAEPMLCCGCAAKLPEQPLMAALQAQGAAATG